MSGVEPAPTFDRDALEEIIDALRSGDPAQDTAAVADVLGARGLDPPRVPGAGWVIVTALEVNGVLAVATLAPCPLLDQLAPDLAALHGRRWFDRADLRLETIVTAARLDAVLGLEWLHETAERYRVAEADLAAWDRAIPCAEGLPERVLGVTASFRCAS